MNQTNTPLIDTMVAMLVAKVDNFLGTKCSMAADNKASIKYINELTTGVRDACNASDIKSSDINWLRAAINSDIERYIDQTIKRLIVLQIALNANNVVTADTPDGGLFNIVLRDRLARQLAAIQTLAENMGELNLNDAFQAIQAVIDNLQVVNEAKEEMVAEVQSIDNDFASTPPSMFVPLAQYASEESPAKKDRKKQRLNEVASKHSSAAKQLNTFVEIA